MGVPLRQCHFCLSDTVHNTDGRGLAPDPGAFLGRDGREHGPKEVEQTRLLDLLHRLLCCVSLLLCQHLRGADNHHVPGAGRGGSARGRRGQEPEVVHGVRAQCEADAPLRARRQEWLELQVLPAVHVAALRELHSLFDHHKHGDSDDEGELTAE
jgi:hypothetical protein